MEKEQNEKSQRAIREEEILEFWKENNIFKKSCEKESPSGDFVFYEGPPTANGKPGIHHLEARSFKDAIPRYKTMKGFRVERKGGWDTHGLPVELQVEKELGLTSKKQIEDFGIDNFNKKCKESVWAYLDIWDKFTHRIGYWVDQENPYITYKTKYIEALWAVLGKVAGKDLLYKDYRIVPWCPRCGTALSSHELAQGYKDVKDLSVYVKFKIKSKLPFDDGKKYEAYVLAWTTTPWTLPGNVALAVGSDINYLFLKKDNEIYIVAENKRELFGDEYTQISSFLGDQLTGLEYEPLYPYLKENLPEDQKEKEEKAFKIYPADFVTTEDGTGVVHTAVMYGQDDFELGTKLGLPKMHLVDDTGHFIKNTGFLENRFVKDEEVAIDIIKDLAHRGLLFKKEKYEHSYPHCWRCKTPLIYYARDSWYIRMSQLRDQLVSENQSINWEPSHIKDGRFGEWLKDIKDWAISRERYWGTPLPVWEAKDGERIIIDSIESLKKNIKSNNNNFIVIRHGQADHNVNGICSNDPDEAYHLTEQGIKDALVVAEKLKDKKIDKVFVSPFVRTKETADIIAKELNIDKDKIEIKEEIREFYWGDFAGRDHHEFDTFRQENMFDFVTPVPNGESYQMAKTRIGKFLKEIDSKYQNQTILLIGHGILQEVVPAIVLGADKKESKEIFKKSSIEHTAVSEHKYLPLPYNDDFEIDLHRPYVDTVVLEKEGKEFYRVKEVMDVWFDSGAMPFAQNAENRGEKSFEEFWSEINYPADFISEAIDQTRGWFYTLHAVGVLLGKGKAYKNVICLGHILDGEGKKMSKSLGNIVDPWIMMDKYGVDAIRLWMYSVNQPGESKNFDEKTVDELVKKVFNLLSNVHAFYDLYKDTAKTDSSNEENILDKWIKTLLGELVITCTDNLDNYRLLEPVRAIRNFIDHLSTWYLRRSRERIKEGDAGAIETLNYVLKTVSKLLAPFAPFTAEDVWQKLKKDIDEESVHLSVWPQVKENIDKNILEKMTQTREFVTAGLEARQKAGIKVRQPLAKLSIGGLELENEYLELIKDEVNVKEVVPLVDKNSGVELDTQITEELKKEGDFRDLVRSIQEMRKTQDLTPNDTISVVISVNGKELVESFMDEFKKLVQASSVSFGDSDGEPVSIGELTLTVSIKKN